MRSIILVAMLSGLCVGVSSAEGLPAADAAAIRASVQSETGALRVTLEGQFSTEQPLIRLLQLPPGAQNLRPVQPSSANSGGIEVELGRPMIMRGQSLLPIVVTATSDGVDANAVSHNRVVTFSVEYDAASAQAAGPGSSRALAYSRGFFESCGDFLLLDDDSLAGRSTALGGYLIVTVPEFVSTLAPLIEWKREIGFEVTVLTTDEAGTRNDEIQAYIKNLYLSAERPPQYVLLVGDVEQIPGFDYHQSVADLPYVLVDGDDFLPDMEIGRLSAQNTTQLETILAKILRYEQDPYRENEEWFSRALMVAADYSSSTPVTVSRWCGDQLLDLGYAAVDSVYYPPHWSTGPPLIKRAIDQGVSLVSYRGWAYGWRGWQPPEFTVDDIPRLDNGWMLPAVFSFVCLNGNFVEPECFGESWLRAGSATEPKGAIAFIGNSEHWSHTRYNDTAAIGVFRMLHDTGVSRLGALLDAVKFEILTQFHGQLLYADWEDNSVEFYFHIYGLLGDPSMEIWTAPPRRTIVQFPETIPAGSTSLDIRVFAEDGVTPVENARVGVSRGDELLGCVYTDADGRANLLASFVEDESPVRITVTGTGLAAHRATAVVESEGPYLALAQVQITDDGTDASTGNGDGIANPGETLAVRVGLTNRGPDMVSAASSDLSALWGAIVSEGSADYPGVATGEQSDPETPFLIQIDAAAEAGLQPRLRLVVDDGSYESVVGFELGVAAPSMQYEAHDLGGEVLAPGETAELSVTLQNNGNLTASTFAAVLRSETPELATVIESSAQYDAVAVGGAVTSSAPFQVQATSDAAMGRGAVFTLTATTTEGYVSETSFSVIIGTVDHRAPLGPDSYGYWAYDNSDTDYPDAVPVYDWITCSPTYGGSGTRLDLRDNSTTTVDLPFPFTFYGRSYDRLLVCDNGWVSFDTTDYYDFYNWTLPNTYGNGAQLAPFWDNLDPDKAHEGVLVGDGIYVLDDSQNHRFVVEWSRIGNLRSQHDEEDRPDYDDLQTFQVVLLDPAFHPTPTGDGVIRFQYKQIVNNDTDRMFSTVGIENETEDIGLQYTYANVYPGAAAPLSAGLAIEFTTTPPRYHPFELNRVEVVTEPGGLRLRWEPCDDRVRGTYRILRSAEGEEPEPVPGGRLAGTLHEFLDTQADPEVAWLYWIVSADPIGFETVLGPYPYPEDTASRIDFSIEVGHPNPSRDATMVTYSVPGESEVHLAIYDASGRVVRTLIDRLVEAGVGSADWDGRDDAGVVMPSGIYFAKLRMGQEQRSVKLTRIR